MAATAPTGVPHEEIRAQLEKMLASASFREAQRSTRLLRFIVEETLAGRAATLKEYTLGADGLQRGPAFDPRTDPIARVEASRLRNRIDLYYANEGAADAVLIALPKGSYVPSFERRQPAAEPTSQAPGAARYLVAGALAGAALMLALGLALLPDDPTQMPRQTMYLDVDVGADNVIASEVGVDFALSPDGSALVYVSLEADGSTRLRVRRLNEPGSRELPGTLGVRAPFMSPDGRWVAFWSEGKLKKTLVDGVGTPVTICDATDLLGGSWGTDGYIVAALSNLSLVRVHEERCEPTTIVPGQAPLRLVWPQILPRGNVALVTAFEGQVGNATIDVLDLASGARKTLVRGGTYGRLLPSGHLIYVNSGTLFAVELDIERLETRGSPVAVLNDVSFSPIFGYAQIDFSADGTLVYRRAAASGPFRLQWLRADEEPRGLLDTPGRYQWLRLSPDGERVAFTLQESSHYDLWIYDTRQNLKTRFAVDMRDQSGPVWTPDGKFVLTGSQQGIYYVPVGDTPEWRQLAQNGALMIPWSFSPDGKWLAYYTMSRETALDLWTVPVEATSTGLHAGDPQPLRVTPAFEVYPTFSPDGRWIAYGSNESGSWEIYVRAFPDDGRQVQVSVRGGRIPAWSRETNELFYRTDDHRIMVVPYSVADGVFVAETPRAWSTARLADTGVIANFDVAADGRAIAALVPAEQSGSRGSQLTFVTNFFDEIERRTAGGPQ